MDENPVDKFIEIAHKMGIQPQGVFDPTYVREMREWMQALVIDYKALLIKYIRHISDAEGIDYISGSYLAITERNDSRFTDEEVGILKELSAMAKELPEREFEY